MGEVHLGQEKGFIKILESTLINSNLLLTLAVCTAMFMLYTGNNLWLLCIGKLPAVLGLDSAALVVKLHSVNVGVNGNCSVVAGHAALIRYCHIPFHETIF